MKITDFITIIIAFIFLSCVGILIYLWKIDKLNYETSIAPQVFEKISPYLYLIIPLVVGLILIFAVVILFWKLYRRTKRQEINIGVIRDMEKDFGVD